MQSPSCLKTWPIHRCFLCQIEFSICLSLFTLLNTSSLVTLSSQLIFSILLHIHISEASNLLLSVCINIHVSAAYSATLQTKHFIILFFSSRFILPGNSFFFSINTFFAISILLQIAFVQYPSSDIKLPKYLNWLTCCLSININFQFQLLFPLRLMHIAHCQSTEGKICWLHNIIHYFSVTVSTQM